MTRRVLTSIAAILMLSSSGCYATKAITVPLRVVGAVSSAAPFVGNTAHRAIDGVAEEIDDIGG
ncbi:MAG: DUF6726 family protein [Myxococcota bacterium]